MAPPNAKAKAVGTSKKPADVAALEKKLAAKDKMIAALEGNRGDADGDVAMDVPASEPKLSTATLQQQVVSLEAKKKRWEAMLKDDPDDPVVAPRLEAIKLEIVDKRK